ncbi:hypothetical protein Despr_1592 [Desulfobulbus propionicus DSM 2032]|uniref:Uncharacterized protein n=1 Tax=Desulfobulbus propionicus (strain ATCC 33891 / DSM 2032 / VKM B-1956 / 1pr3) TaxID=577650 RepID=A0A7U3YLS5_DESPD|nr:hypothetical protein [Desulfobulbus propionicus]ADW17744.1 hypothetical protein Despr_1592 [Desulfobulbus propionicus DSM 2032]
MFLSARSLLNRRCPDAKTSLLLLLLVVLPSLAASAEPPLDLSQQLGRDCHPVDARAWKSPALEIVRQRPKTELQWVQLCREGQYPVFGVRFAYDPQGQTNDFFYPLFLDVLEANGHRPFAFVETQDRLLIEVGGEGGDQLDLNYIQLDLRPN